MDSDFIKFVQWGLSKAHQDQLSAEMREVRKKANDPNHLEAKEYSGHIKSGIEQLKQKGLLPYNRVRIRVVPDLLSTITQSIFLLGPSRDWWHFRIAVVVDESIAKIETTDFSMLSWVTQQLSLDSIFETAAVFVRPEPLPPIWSMNEITPVKVSHSVCMVIESDD